MPFKMFGVMDMALRVRNPKRRVQRSLYEAFADVCTALRSKKVPFMLHGAWAVAAYGFTRATEDVDFLVPNDPDTLRRVYGAMKGLRAVPVSPGPPNAEEALVRKSKHIQFNLVGWPIDFFFDADFQALRKRSRRRRIGAIQLRVISPADLARKKRERGTDLDLIDVKHLEASEE
jgi:hypothetical protein